MQHKNDTATAAPPPQLLHPKYRPDIDGLRALAVLSVVAFHAFPGLAAYGLSGGFIGVDVFFVISGFLISTIIFENLDKETFSFTEFYSRRITRIFPALLLVLIASYAFGWFALFADEYKQLGMHIAAGAGFFSNFALWNEAGYFDNSSETKPLLHLWSLGIEEQFYIVWPLLLWVAWKKKFNLLTITILVLAISFYLNVKGIKKDAVATFYSPQTRFWELLCGSVLAWVTLYKKDSFSTFRTKLDGYLASIVYREKPVVDGNALSNVISFIGMSLLVYGFWKITKEARFPGTKALLPVLGTVLIIAAGPTAWINRTILSNKIAVWFGLISFPLYLWHWPLLSFARIIESEVPSRNIRIAAVLISIVLAWLTYKLIERPIRFGKQGLAKPILLLLAMMIVGFLGYNSYQKNGLDFREAAKLNGVIENQFAPPGYWINDICLKRYPFENNPKAHWFCIMNKAESPTLLLVGHSFANHLYLGVSTNASFKHHTILSFGICDASAPGASPGEADYEPSGACNDKYKLSEQNYIDKIINESGTVKFAIFKMSSNFDPRYILRFKKRIDAFEAKGIQVVVVTPNFIKYLDMRSCLRRPFKKRDENCDFDVSERKQIADKTFQIELQFSKTNPNVKFYDPNDLFCDDKKCSYVKDGKPLSRDLAPGGSGGHLSDYGSIEWASLFEQWARKNLPSILDNQTISENRTQ